MIQWKGVFPALTTKFKDNLQLDIPAFQKNLEAQIGAGIDGVIVGGSLGEASTITHEEKMELLKAALDTAKGRIPILVNIAERSTAAAVKIAEDAQAGGAQGLMALPPMQYKATDAEVVRYFQDIAQSTDLPILIYNNPVDYKIEVTLDMFETLLKEKNIQAVKESTRDISNVSRIISRFGDRLKVLCGVDTLAMEELVMGADGWVAGLVCAFPRETVAVYRLTKAGRLDEAREQRMWVERLALQLGMELHADEPGMVRPLDDFGQQPVRRHAGKDQAALLQGLTVSGIDLVAMAVTLADVVGAAVERRDMAVGAKHRVIGAKPHGSAQIGVGSARLKALLAHPFSDDTDHRFTGLAEFGGRSRSDSGVSNALDARHLHAEADSEKGNRTFARKAH